MGRLFEEFRWQAVPVCSYRFTWKGIHKTLPGKVSNAKMIPISNTTLKDLSFVATTVFLV